MGNVRKYLNVFQFRDSECKSVNDSKFIQFLQLYKQRVVHFLQTLSKHFKMFTCSKYQQTINFRYDITTGHNLNVVFFCKNHTHIQLAL